MSRSMSMILWCLVLFAFVVPQIAIAQSKVGRSYGVAITIVDSHGHTLAGIPVNIERIYSSGGLRYTEAIYLKPTFTTKQGLATFTLTPGEYQIVVGGNSAVNGAIRVLRVRDRNPPVKIVLSEKSLVVEPADVFGSVNVKP